MLENLSYIAISKHIRPHSKIRPYIFFRGAIYILSRVRTYKKYLHNFLEMFLHIFRLFPYVEYFSERM